MNSVKFNTKSWHGRLVGHYHLAHHIIRPRDICSYIRGVIRGTILALLIVLLSSYILASLLSLVLAMWFWISPSDWSIPGIVLTGLVTTALGGTVATIELQKAKDKYFNNRGYSPKKKEPGFMKIAYRKFKEKTCFFVELSGE